MSAKATSYTGGDLVIDTLVALGATHVVGLPGQHALPIFNALKDSGLQYYGARVENNAGFIADGAARATGAPIPLLLSAGPGALTVLPALQEALTASSPVMVIAAQIPRAGLGSHRRGFLHELDDQEGHFRNVCKKTWSIRSVEQIVPILAQAWNLSAAAPYGPVFVEIPYDVQIQKLSSAASFPSALSLKELGSSPKQLAAPAFLQAAIDVLNNSKNPRIYAGGGVVRSEASKELQAVAERIGAPVVTTFAGREALPWNHPLSAQGWIEDIATTEFLEEADALLVIGTGLGELTTNYFTLRPRGTIIHIDADERVLGAHFPSIGLCGDARMILQQLLPQLEQKHTCARDDIQELLNTVTNRLDAQDLGMERTLLSSIRASVPASVGTYWDMTILAYWAWSAWDAQGGQFENAQCGGLGFGLPAAIGASFSGQDADNPHGLKAVAVSGDGGGLYSIADLASLAESGLDVTWIVIDDGGYGVLRGYMDGAFGQHMGTDLQVPDYVGIAQAMGIPAQRVRGEETEKVSSVIAEAIKQAGPRVIVIEAHPELFAATHLDRVPLY